MEESNKFIVPVAIIIAGALIAWGLISNDSPKTDDQNNDDQGTTVQMMPVSEKDHILGDPNAELIIVEYSDLECPFCKNFYITTKKIMDEYGKDGKVALVFRHFPLDTLHSQARGEAIATECATELGGNEKFWEYMDELFAITPSNNGLDLAQLPVIAKKIGLDEASFMECLNNPEMAQKVEEQFQDGIVAGAKGTPYSLILDKDGGKTVINGAQPYNVVKEMIESLLNR
ncbi:MAG: DsbA family protein [Candidatus Pacebacteria bacterium]|nr:DsbA family protein [Candidatus Paceibacterota bacterium]